MSERTVTIPLKEYEDLKKIKDGLRGPDSLIVFDVLKGHGYATEVYTKIEAYKILVDRLSDYASKYNSLLKKHNDLQVENAVLELEKKKKGWFR